MLDLRTRDDLQRLVDERLPESLTLDYKDSRALNKQNDGRNELVKDVLAFANSAGGQIVYGIYERQGIPQRIDDGVDPTLITPEWIDQVVTTNSSPRLQNLSIRTIELSAEPRKVAYVLTIPQSSVFAPHQNSMDHKYYRRFDLRSVPMADYEIRDVLRRNDSPVLQVEYKLSSGREIDDFDWLESRISVRPSMKNISPASSLYSMFDILIDDRLEVLEFPDRVRDLGIMDLWNRRFRHFQLYYKVPDDFPLVSGISVNLSPADFILGVRISRNDDVNVYMLAYNGVSSPGSITSGFQTILLRGERVSITEHTLVMKDGVGQLPDVSEAQQEPELVDEAGNAIRFRISDEDAAR